MLSKDGYRVGQADSGFGYVFHRRENGAVVSNLLGAGYCGAVGEDKNLKWIFDANGTLSVSGNGRMKDYNRESYTSPPWDEVLAYERQEDGSRIPAQVTALELGNGITYIGREAFSFLNGITSVTIPAGTEIGEDAFHYCVNLNTLTIGSDAKVGERAFKDCEDLETITIKEGVTEIGDNAFQGCKISSLVLPNSLRYIGAGAFSDCSNLATVTMGSIVTDSGYRNTNSPFEDSPIQTVSFTCPNGVVGRIPSRLFSPAIIRTSSSLKRIYIPLGITTIEENAFHTCENIEDVYYAGSETKWGEIDIEEGNDSVLHATIHFTEESDYMSGIIRQGDGWAMKWKCIYTIDDEGARTKPRLEIYMEGTDNSDGWKFSVSDTSPDIAPWLAATGFSKADFTKVTVKGSSKNPIHIAASQFAGYTGVKTLEIQNVYSFGDEAFKGCSSLEGIKNFNAKLLSIGNSAFKDCIALKSISGRASNLQNVGLYAFSNTSLQYFDFGDNLASIERNAFEGCQVLKKITVPSSLQTIEENAFSGCDNITKISYKGDKTGWNNINIKSGNSSIDFGKVQYVVPSFERLFMSDPKTYSNEIAQIAAELSEASYSNDASDVKDLLENQGFEENQIITGNYSIGTLAYVVATKEYGGEDADYIAIIVAQGSTNVYELVKDATASASRTYNGLPVYDIVDDFYLGIRSAFQPIRGKRYKILLAGHSLGGAATNLMAAYLTDKSVSQNNQFDVFCYTFGAINSIGGNKQVKRGYENIHNVYNLLDTFSPYQEGGLLPTGMGQGYGKFGQMEMFAHEYRSIPEMFLLPLGQILLHKNHDMSNYVEAIESERVLYSKYRSGKSYSVAACPVDVSVYQGGNLVGRTVNNEVDQEVTNIDLSVDSDVKTIIYPDDQEYDLRFSAFNEGTMTFATIAKDEQGQIKIISDIAVDSGKQLSSKVGGDVEVSNVKLYVTNSNGEAVSEIKEDGTEVAVTPTPSGETSGTGGFDGGGFGGGGGGASETVPENTTIITEESENVIAGYPSAKFTDVAPNSWYRQYVDYVLEEGIMTGVGENRFAPNQPLTRNMLVTIMWRLEGTPEAGKTSFNDVKQGSWYESAVAWAEGKKLVEGDGSGRFNPTGNITREQFAAILYRYSQMKNYDVGKSDNLLTYNSGPSVSSWAMSAMQWANAKGFITGRTATSLEPQGEATRAETAAILMRFIERYK